MTEPTLFGDDTLLPPPISATGQATPGGSPRLRPVQRQQVEMRCASLDQLLPPDHEARSMWAYVENVNLAPLLKTIKAVAGQPGRDANDPPRPLRLVAFCHLQGCRQRPRTRPPLPGSPGLSVALWRHECQLSFPGRLSFGQHYPLQPDADGNDRRPAARRTDRTGTRGPGRHESPCQCRSGVVSAAAVAASLSAGSRAASQRLAA